MSGLDLHTGGWDVGISCAARGARRNEKMSTARMNRVAILGPPVISNASANLEFGLREDWAMLLRGMGGAQESSVAASHNKQAGGVCCVIPVLSGFSGDP